jgi:outer membrane lipoprotein-sorting protein
MRLNPTVILGLFCCAALSPAQDARNVLSRMDGAAAGFRGVSASIDRVMHTAILNENTEESGRMRMLRPKARDFRMVIEFEKPDPKVIAFRDKKAEIYYPKIQTVQEYDLGKQSSLVDQFLLLGFGTPGRELARSYDVKYVGVEQVAGTKSDRLELTPKSAKVREHIKRVELWVSESGHPVRQRYYENSGNHTTITYTDLKVNPALTPADVTMQLPSGVKREVMGN